MFNKNSEGGPSKLNFYFGLVSGIAVISTLAFFIILVVFLGNGGDKVIDKEDSDALVDIVDDGGTLPPSGSDVPAVSNSDYIRGDKNAPVTMIVYDDFECPYCLRFKATLDQVLDEYDGKVRLVYRHFPLSFHANAQKAAEAAECAGEQGKFWEMHDAIFQANADKNMSVDKWKSEASKLGLNTADFNSCLDDGKYASKISSHMSSGAAAGVKGTPATFVNGELVSGALPYDTFKEIIDTLLAE